MDIVAIDGSWYSVAVIYLSDAGGPFNSWVSEGGGPGHVTVLANQRPPRPLSPTDPRFWACEGYFASSDRN